MKLAILADIHDHVWTLRAALGAITTTCDALLCCGDLCSPFIVSLLATGFRGPIQGVAGNNEGDWRQIMLNAATANQTRGPAAQLTFAGQFFQGEFGGKRIAINHYPDIAKAIATSGQYDLVCFGHNHQYELCPGATTLALNPGTLMGYNPLTAGEVKEVPATFAIYDTDVPADRAVAFYQVAHPWRSVDEPGQVVHFHPEGSSAEERTRA